jgi:hypothetical protein
MATNGGSGERERLASFVTAGVVALYLLASVLSRVKPVKAVLDIGAEKVGMLRNEARREPKDGNLAEPRDSDSGLAQERHLIAGDVASEEKSTVENMTQEGQQMAAHVVEEEKVAVEGLAGILDELMDWHSAIIQGEYAPLCYRFFMLPFVLYSFIWFSYIEFHDTYFQQPVLAIDWVEDEDLALQFPSIEICPSSFSFENFDDTHRWSSSVGLSVPWNTPHFSSPGCREYRLIFSLTQQAAKTPAMEAFVSEVVHDYNNSVFVMTKHEHNGMPVYYAPAHRHSNIYWSQAEQGETFIFYSKSDRCWVLGQSRYMQNNEATGYDVLPVLKFAREDSSNETANPPTLATYDTALQAEFWQDTCGQWQKGGMCESDPSWMEQACNFACKKRQLAERAPTAQQRKRRGQSVRALPPLSHGHSSSGTTDEGGRAWRRRSRQPPSRRRARRGRREGRWGSRGGARERKEEAGQRHSGNRRRQLQSNTTAAPVGGSSSPSAYLRVMTSPAYSHSYSVGGVAGGRTESASFTISLTPHLSCATGSTGCTHHAHCASSFCNMDTSRCEPLDLRALDVLAPSQNTRRRNATIAPACSKNSATGRNESGFVGGGDSGRNSWSSVGIPAVDNWVAVPASEECCQPDTCLDDLGATMWVVSWGQTSIQSAVEALADCEKNYATACTLIRRSGEVYNGGALNSVHGVPNFNCNIDLATTGYQTYQTCSSDLARLVTDLPEDLGFSDYTHAPHTESFTPEASAHFPYIQEGRPGCLVLNSQGTVRMAGGADQLCVQLPSTLSEAAPYAELMLTAFKPGSFKDSFNRLPTYIELGAYSQIGVELTKKTKWGEEDPIYEYKLTSESTPINPQQFDAFSRVYANLSSLFANVDARRTDEHVNLFYQELCFFTGSTAVETRTYIKTKTATGLVATLGGLWGFVGIFMSLFFREVEQTIDRIPEKASSAGPRRKILRFRWWETIQHATGYLPNLRRDKRSRVHQEPGGIAGAALEE